MPGAPTSTPRWRCWVDAVAREPDDFYRTGPDAILALHGLLDAFPGFTLDPCAGDGGLLAGSALVWGQGSFGLRGVELHQGRAEQAAEQGWPVTQGDGLALSWRDEGAIINPPFSNAQPFIEKAATQARFGAVLLPLGYLASAERSAWWRSLPAPRLRVLSVRASFLANGKISSQDYAWYLWGERFADCPPVSWFECPIERQERIALALKSRELRRDQVTW